MWIDNSVSINSWVELVAGGEPFKGLILAWHD